MNDGFHFLDIVFFAVVAAFLILRLRSVLGRRTGNERPARGWNSGTPVPAEAADDSNVIELNRKRKGADDPALFGGPAGDGLAAIRAADPDFTAEGFMVGARAAFEMIVGAYAAGDKTALRPLLSDEVFANFAAAIETRMRAGETLETELVSLRAADVIEAGLKSGKASITVRFVSEQINVVRDGSGRVVDGSPTEVAEVVDEWTFQRAVRASDPNWMLVATRSPDAEA